MGGLCWKVREPDVDSKSPQTRPKEEKKQSRVTAQDMALCDLKKRKRECDEYITSMEVKIKESKATALKYSKAKEKSKAIFAMKLKKMYEKTKEKVEGARHLLETSIISVEQARLDAAVYAALKNGEEVLTELQKKVSVDDFQTIYDNMQERQQLNEYLGTIGDDDGQFADELDHLEEQLAKVGEPSVESKVEERLGREDVQAPTHEIRLEVKKEEPAAQEEQVKEPLLA